MVDVHTMLKSGYKSLASETLWHFNEISASLQPLSTELLEWLSQYKKSLEAIKDTGDILAIGERGRDSLKAAIEILEMKIPNSFKPSNEYESMAFALHVVKTNLRVSDEELRSRMGLTGSYRRSDGYGGFVWGDDNGKLTKHFCPSHDPTRPILSTIGDIHELIHILQPETIEVHGRYTKRRQIRGFLDLEKRIDSEAGLRERMLKKVTEEHQLSYLLEPEVQMLAEQTGVDMKAFNAYLRENIPTFNFNYCFVEGDAFLRTVEMLRNPALMQKAPNELKRYALIALTYALVAPFSEPKPKIYEVGVGMVRYMGDNIGLEEQLKQSRSFHEELTRAYFKLPNI